MKYWNILTCLFTITDFSVFHRYNWSIETSYLYLLLHLHTYLIPPIQLKYWNSTADAVAETLSTFHRYNWSIETYLLLCILFQVLQFHRYNWSIETTLKVQKVGLKVDSTDTIEVLKRFIFFCNFDYCIYSTDTIEVLKLL